jgi:hypothetical protein
MKQKLTARAEFDCNISRGWSATHIAAIHGARSIFWVLMASLDRAF